MSLNPSRFDGGDTVHRKSASSNQQRPSSGACGKGAGQSAGPAHSPSITSSSSTSNRSSLKKSSDAPGGQAGVNVPAANSSDSTNASTTRHVPNSAQAPPQLQRGAEAPVGQIEVSTTPQRTLPEAPTSQSASMSSASTGSTTPTQVPGDASEAFLSQYVSVRPDFMQIAVRISPDLPNLNEQTHVQARPVSFRPASKLLTREPNQQMPRKNSEQFNAQNSLQALNPRRDFHVSSQTPKSSVPSIPVSSTPVKIHPPKPSSQFGAPNLPTQSQ